MELNPFLPEHGDIFLEYQSRRKSASELAHSAFQPHYIWSDLLEYRWAILEGLFCLFATSHGVTHVALAPFGLAAIEPAATCAFEHIARMNPSHIPSRIDNVDEAEATALRAAGFTVTQGTSDYLYLRDEIINLSGNRFRSQRGAYNQAARFSPTLRPFSSLDIADCLTVFEQWATEQWDAGESNDSLNLMMKQDARFAHHAVMKGYRELVLTGRVVEVNNIVAGYTFGFPLSQETFCVLLEITNKRIRGLSTWLFREFCRELSSYTFINAMDDSGLLQLAKTKSLWNPIRMIPSYTVTL
jgi:hypothetical protein